jgi:hypothetical protein
MKRLKNAIIAGFAGLMMAVGMGGCDSATKNPPEVATVTPSSTTAPSNAAVTPSPTTAPSNAAVTDSGNSGGGNSPTTAVVAATPSPTTASSSTATSDITGTDGRSSKIPLATTVATTTTSVIKPPIKFVIGIDLTDSSDVNRVVTPATEQIKDAALVVERVGGQLRIDAIGSQSDTSMIAVSFAEPEAPLPPLEPAPNEDSVNPLERPALREKYQAKKVLHDSEQQKHDQREARRNADNQRKLEAFLAKVTPLLKLRGTQKSTDIVGMGKRMNLFLKEPYLTKGQAARQIALLVTDGEETIKKNPEAVKFADGTEVIIVCAGSGTGILKGQQFENLDSAIRYLSDKY